MAGVDAAFHSLEPVAVLPGLGHEVLVVAAAQPFHGRRPGALPDWAEVGPDHAAQLDGRMGLHADLLLEPAGRGLVRHVHAGALNIEFPAVVHAAQTALLVPTQEHGGQTVRAVLLEQPDVAVCVAEGDELLPQQLYS